MSKVRCTPWVVLACIGTLAGCASGEGGTAGNTELNVVVPNNGDQSPAPDGSPQPAAIDIQVVEYTIACDDGIDSGPFLDNGATLDDDVTISGILEVLDTASSGVTIQDFGPDLTEVYVWQGFMDLPPTAGCTVQLRARDGDGEVICTATETFDISADTTTKVNVLMYCGISFQAPVGMLDLDGDFSFNVANFCPDLFVLNCIDSELDVRRIPGVGDVLGTACQVRFRDADSQCGDSCDPQTCTTTPTGLSCSPGPDPGTPTTTVTCASTLGACAISCDGFGTPAPSCTFTGDTLGGIGDPAPGLGAPGAGGFYVVCATFDHDGEPLTPEIPTTPGDDIVCTAVTTDGDTDCDKTKTVDLTMPGIPPCGAFVAGGGSCADGNDCTDDVCTDVTCDGSTAASCCTNPNSPPSQSCTDGGGFPGYCDGAGTCISPNCNAQPDPDAACDDGNPCTAAGDPGSCTPDGTCDATPTNEGGACDSGRGPGSGTCQSGTCIGRPQSVRVETFNIALAGAFIPFEAERRDPLINAIPTTNADIICLQEVWEQADKDAIVAAAASEFPHSVVFTHDLDTPVDDPTDQNGQIPAMPSGVPCPDANVGDFGANLADQLDQTAQCLADFCSTTGDETGRTTSAECAANACTLSVAGLLLGNELQQRCYACAVTQLPTEVIATLVDRCKTIENQDLAFRGQNGVMILSRFPLSNEETFVVPGTWNRRVVVNATATLPNGAELDVHCNHLTPIFNVTGINTFPYTGQYGGGATTEPEQWAAEQRLQAEKLITYVQQTSGTRPAVVLGDINAGREVRDAGGQIVLYAEGEPTLDVLESVLTLGAAANYEPLCTFCDTNPLNGVEDTLPAWIDHIYLYGLDASTVVSTERTFDEFIVPVQIDDGMGGTTGALVPLSDHYGLRSVILVP